MNLLELFSGTGSVGTIARSLGFNVISLDLKNADINCDILQWDYKQFDRNHFQFIWSSPPCTEYSKAKTTGIRNIEYANSIVLKTLEIIDYFGFPYFVIENPQTGLLKSQSFMNGLRFNDIDYCKYGFNYRKRTRLWNNLNNWKRDEVPFTSSGWKPRPLCKKDCGKVVNNKHIETAQRAPSGKRENWCENYVKHKQEDLYKIPAELICEILVSLTD